MMKIVRLFGYLVFVFFILSSCNSKSDEKVFVVGFSQCTGADAWRVQMLSSMNRELLFHPELKLLYKDAGGDNKKQVQDIRDLVKQGVDLLIVSPNEADPITPVVEEVFKLGIPVVVVDRMINSSFYTAYIGADNFEIGKLAGHYVGDLLNGKGKIMEIWGLHGSTPAVERHRGFANALKEYPGILTSSEIDGEWEIDTVKNRLVRKIDAIPPVDLVFAHNDVMAYGAYEVFKQKRDLAQTKFIGIDGLPGPGGGIQLVADNILAATFLYPTGGEEAIRVASRILRKESFEKDNQLLSTLVDPRNVRVMKLQTDKITSQQGDITRLQEMINSQLNAYSNQRLLVYFLLGSLIVTIVVGAAAIIAWHEKKEMNLSLALKSEEILNQKDQIAEMAKQAEAATQEKLLFFTNISHEFKTPLTLILGPIEELLSKNSTESKVNQVDNLKLVKKNTIRLLRLVNQLMDFRKIEDRKMPMRVSKIDLVAFISDIMQAFKKTASNRKIDFKLFSEIDEIPVWFDPDKMDKVVFNLLSNAFKFTPDKGKVSISISMHNHDNSVSIFIEDNGVGMTKEQASHAFDRFYTADNVTGTGLGLSLSRELIEMHHGKLAVTSEEGQGARFCIVLKLGKEHFAPTEIIEGNQEYAHQDFESLIDDTHFPKIVSDSMPELMTKENTILLIDDNEEMRHFLKTRLQAKYHIHESDDGVQGIQVAFDFIPDLIICDVMLPGMNGYDVVSTLKTDLRTSHIPIILLTAKGSIEQIIEGIKMGADEYITKPFVFDYLNEIIRMLLRNRKALKEHYVSDLNLDQKNFAPGSMDRKFVNQFIAIVEKNISNVDLNVNGIARELGVSRVQIYRKVKALMGFSVNDYLVRVRLKKAKFLLLTTDKTVAEISQEVGFSSPAYFSTIFKNKLSLSPKEFKNNRNYAEDSV